jgi:hypothetical protein
MKLEDIVLSEISPAQKRNATGSHSCVGVKKIGYQVRYRWFTPVIPATWEVEIWRITLETSLGKSFGRPPSPKEPEQNGLEVWLKW